MLSYTFWEILKQPSLQKDNWNSHSAVDFKPRTSVYLEMVPGGCILPYLLSNASFSFHFKIFIEHSSSELTALINKNILQLNI